MLTAFLLHLTCSAAKICHFLRRTLRADGEGARRAIYYALALDSTSAHVDPLSIDVDMAGICLSLKC